MLGNFQFFYIITGFNSLKSLKKSSLIFEIYIFKFFDTLVNFHIIIKRRTIDFQIVWFSPK
jgi:hypothetical protein